MNKYDFFARFLAVIALVLFFKAQEKPPQHSTRKRLFLLSLSTEGLTVYQQPAHCYSSALSFAYVVARVDGDCKSYYPTLEILSASHFPIWIPFDALKCSRENPVRIFAASSRPRL